VGKSEDLLQFKEKWCVIKGLKKGMARNKEREKEPS